MSLFVWCKREERRIPSYRCYLCRENCHTLPLERFGEESLIESLIQAGKVKERFIMKRKEGTVLQEDAAPASDELKALPIPAITATPSGQVFILEEGRLKPFARELYTVSTLYEIAESFDVECRLVKPEDPGHLLYEGKKPSRKTLPVIITKGGESVFLDSWENLETDPAQLADASEVLGVTPMKQVFVLKRRNVS